MKDVDKKHFEDLLVRAVQSGKRETSGLVQDLKKELLKEVREEIKITVNGKIDGIKKHLEEQDRKDEIRFKSIETKLDELKPVGRGIRFLKGTRDFAIWITPLGVLYGIYQWLKN